MATAKKLPSGNWRVRAYDKKTDKYKSFTAPTKKQAELMAAVISDRLNPSNNANSIAVSILVPFVISIIFFISSIFGISICFFCLGFKSTLSNSRWILFCLSEAVISPYWFLIDFAEYFSAFLLAHFCKTISSTSQSFISFISSIAFFFITS